MTVSMVYVTIPSKEDALKMARKIVSEELAACGNIIDQATSVYRWQGEVQEEQEAILILKTRGDLLSRLTDRIRELHSYEVPCIVAYQTQFVDADYRKWIESSTLAF